MGKSEIQKAINGIAAGNLTQTATALLDSIGLKSPKQMPLETKSFDEFIKLFNQEGKLFNKDKAFINDWLSIDFLFQITADELKQHIDFSKKAIDKNIAESYLFFCLELKKSEYSRSALSQITREINKLFLMPALIVFKTGDNLTLSIINRRQNKRDDTKDVLEKITLIKDINIKNTHRAHIDILHDLSIEQLKTKFTVSSFLDLHNAWQEVLDTKELNKKFYKELSEWYYWAMGEVYFPNKKEQDVMPIAKGKWKGIPAVRETNAKHLIRLLTRILFVWFIKEKKLVGEELFKENALKLMLKDFNKNGDNSNYYKAILQNLFFATLNQEITERKFRTHGYQGRSIANQWRYERFFADKDKFVKLTETIPFLNGGLFECLDKFEYKTVDGKEREDKEKSERIDWFSDEEGNELEVPNKIFFIERELADLSTELGDKARHTEVRGLFNILNNYKFTIAENTPIEEDIALDPELLGNVFENLLASYNPETKTTARKQTGSYYTPKEIVNYMVDESLKLYLKQALQEKTKMSESEIDTGLEILFAYTEKNHCFNEAEKTILIQAIDSCKILDPACGSGAFPMGALHKLVYILHKLDPDNKLWMERQIKELSSLSDPVQYENAVADTEESFKNNELDYGRKLFLIKNCIYGVDIQPVATQISKLRFLISLMVDQKVDFSKPKENFKIRALPNLETKFVTANTLIGLPQRDNRISMFDNSAVEKLQKQIEQIRSEMFSAKNIDRKKKLRKQDQELHVQLKQELLKGGANQAAAEMIAAWNSYDQSSSSPFFDHAWMFGIKEGFDIVIGNPPYLEARNSSFDDATKDKLQAYLISIYGNADFVARGADLLIYFYEASLRFINKRGVNVFITQNSWLDTEYGSKFQKYLLNKTNTLLVLDSDSKYFETANINTIITIFEGKQGCNKNINFVRCHEDLALCPLSEIVAGGITEEVATIKTFAPNDKLLKEKWGLIFNSSDLLFTILNKLNTAGKKVENLYNFSIGQGLNITKSYMIKRNEFSFYGIDETHCIAYMTVDESNKFCWGNSDTFLIDGRKINQEQRTRLKFYGKDIFADAASRKKPMLILPRGIGSKHYCTFNQISGYSASYVDVYYSSNLLTDDVLRIWLYLNSSICWLLRETSGRKNLGGGMLKAEAVDLKSFPIYFNFKNIDLIKAIFKKHQGEEALNVLDEIETNRHKEIDDLVFSELNFTKEERDFVIKELKEKYSQRCKKSQSL